MLRGGMRLKRGVLGAAALLATFGAGTALASTAPGQPRVELSSDPGDLVIGLREIHGEIESSDHAWMHIYADGRVERHVPTYMSNSGDYVGKIDLDELSHLVDAIAGQGLLEFDAQTVRQVQRESESLRETVFYSSDPSIIEIEVRVAGYQPVGALRLKRDVQKTVTWTGLRADARRYKEVGAVQALNSTFQQLTDVADRVVAQGIRSDEGGDR